MKSNSAQRNSNEQPPRLRIRWRGSGPEQADSGTKEIELSGKITIGRAANNQVVLQSRQRDISGHQLELEWRNNQVLLINHSDKGATYLNGNVLSPGVEVILTLTGQQIRLGKYYILMIERADEDAKTQFSYDDDGGDTKVYHDDDINAHKTQFFYDDDGGDTQVYHEDDTNEALKTQFSYDDDGGETKVYHDDDTNEALKTQFSYDDDGGDTKVYHDDDTNEALKTQFSYDDDGGDTKVYHDDDTKKDDRRITVSVSEPDPLTKTVGSSEQGHAPKLIVRWQTPFLLFIMLGLPVALIFGWLLEDYMTPLAVLFYMLVIGFGSYLLYYQLQLKRRAQD